ncbi:tetratricopeptide repeat protein [Sphingosinicella sp. LHD-64]|uniref:tetratricopeptide repeat protein n=1 Tax=Sphingosinicella sp. LHD-64 TaxID=3072139 RepID=UPI00280C7042|nr:tetratricopeptide repeat protein [Sphingosinicella sp. LHD-64]MDQ8757759.1 tetratricopeptide repeat protein [Sphingosinicella sp. LHD-64]
MNKTRITLATAVALGVTGEFFNVSADAQGLRMRDRDKEQRERGRGQQEGQQQQGQARIDQLSREENAAIVPVYQAVQSQDWATAQAGLPAAQQAAQSPYARYVVGQLQLQIGTGTNNTQLQAQAVDAMVASGGAPAESVPQLLRAQANFALQASNYPVAEAALTRLLEANPNDADLIGTLGQVKLRQNKNDEALALFRRAIEVGSAGGQRPSEDVYKRALAAAYQARMVQPSLELAQALVTAYPTPANWRDTLLIYKELVGVQGSVDLDLFRLMRAVGALTSEADYVLYAEQLNRGGLPGEVKAVLDQGVSRNVLRAGGAHAQLLSAANGAVADDRAGLAGQRAAAMSAPDARRAVGLADAFASYGQYAEAATLYRAALQKSGADAGMINTRLGAALAQAGQRAEAEAAFRAVGSGPYQQLAAFWLLWLQSRPAA